jgi:electron transport complex protein RnfB
MTLLLSGGLMLGLGSGVALLLGWADRAFRVRVDMRIRRVMDLLPGANCGGCGYTGCSDYAEAVAKGEAPADRCPVGGPRTAEAISASLGLDTGAAFPRKAVLHCGTHTETRKRAAEYTGAPHCFTAHLVSGVQECTFGCLGFGDCAEVCSFDALQIKNGAANINHALCTGCGACADVCPRSLLEIIPFKNTSMPVVACANQDKGPDVRSVCSHGCIGCRACPRKLDCFKVETTLASIDYTLFNPETDKEGLEAAQLCCPMGGIRRSG